MIPDPPEVNAKSYILVEAHTNEIISDFTNSGDSNTSGNDFSIKVISATVSDHGGVTNGKLVILFDK